MNAFSNGLRWRLPMFFQCITLVAASGFFTTANAFDAEGCLEMIDDMVRLNYSEKDIRDTENTYQMFACEQKTGRPFPDRYRHKVTSPKPDPFLQGIQQGLEQIQNQQQLQSTTPSRPSGQSGGKCPCGESEACQHWSRCGTCDRQRKC